MSFQQLNPSRWSQMWYTRRMKKVPETHHLRKREDTWYFVRRVPLHLVPAIGKTVLKKSLGTPDLKIAKAKRNAEEVAADALFARMEAALISGSDEASKEVSIAQLTDHLRAHIAKADARSAARLLADPPEDEAQKAEMTMDAEIILGILRNRDDPRGGEWIDTEERKVLTSAGARVTDRQTEIEFAELLRRGLVELQRRKLDRFDGRYDRAFHDPLFDPARTPDVTFASLIETFLSEKMKDYAANDRTEKSADRIRAAAAYLAEVVGDSTPVHSIDDDVIQRTRELISATPSNRNKVYPGLPLTDQIAKAAKHGKPSLSAHTQGFYLDTLRDVLKVAVRKKFLPFNPAEDARPLRRETLAPEEKRLPWTPEQLTGFFCGAFYRSCGPDSSKPYRKADRPWRFWLPLLMLFSGARPGEILQLETGDVRQTDAGTWFFDLMNEDESKRLKTSSSRRRVPIHTELLRLGFLAFVEQRRKAANATGPRLFHNVVPDKYGSLTDRPSKSFNRTFIPAEIKLGERQALYSLRHNVRDALRRIKAPPEALRHIAGWSD